MQMFLKSRPEKTTPLAVSAVFVFALFGLLNACVSSSESVNLTGVYSANAIPDEPFTRRDSLEISDERFTHSRRYYDDQGLLIYLKRHWGYYKVERDTLFFMDIGRDSVYNSKGIDLNKRIESVLLGGENIWHGMAFRKSAVGFRFQDKAYGSPVWVEWTRNL